MKSNNLPSSTSHKPALKCHYGRLTSLATRLETSLPVASTECRSTDEKKILVAMLFADNTIRAYDPKSLKLIGSVIDLRSRASHTVICSVDESTVVTGDAEGRLILSNVRTGHVSVATQAHAGAVISLDSWQQYIVSVGRDSKLRIFRFVNGELLRIEVNLTLHDVEVAVKLASMGGFTRVLVAYGNHMYVFAVDNLNLLKTVRLLRDADSLAEHRLVDIAVNETRTRLAVAIDNKSCLKIMTGDFVTCVYTGACVVTTDSCGHAKPKVTWSTIDSRLWFTDSDGAAFRLGFGEVTESTALGGSSSELVCLQVCRIGGHEVIITGGKNGEVTLWN